MIILLSSPPVIITELLRALVMHRTGAMCSDIFSFMFKPLRSQTMMLISFEPVKRNWLCFVTAMQFTLSVCPEKRLKLIVVKQTLDGIDLV